MKKDSSESLSRTQLETLSTGELIKLADGYGIDIPADLERIFIIEELLECSSEGRKDTDEMQINHSFPETAALPKQYSISFIDVLIRDPLWVFAFWEIKENDRLVHENAADFKGTFCASSPYAKTMKNRRQKKILLRFQSM